MFRRLATIIEKNIKMQLTCLTASYMRVIIWKKLVSMRQRWAYIFFGVIVLVLWIPYLCPIAKPDQVGVSTNVANLEYLISNLTLLFTTAEYSTFKYLVQSSKCKIPNIDPFVSEILPFLNRKKYIKCTDKNLLSYLTKQNNLATLHIDERFIKEYSTSGVYCCYSAVRRGESQTDPDDVIDVSQCTEFSNSTVLPEDVILVMCRNGKAEEVYKNAHAVVTVTEDVEKKMNKFETVVDKQHLSVLMIGIDAVSRLNLIRSMPYTYDYLQKNGWIDFKGYNKIGDNTFPNLGGVLTGKNRTTLNKVCDKGILRKLDECNIIWYDYRYSGFVTAYAEDEAEHSTFNWLSKGFKKKPVDYYFRKYVLATEEHLDYARVDYWKYCTGPESTGERILNLAREFSLTFKDYPNFGLFWMNGFSHNELNSVSRMDTKVVDFLSDINGTGILDNSIVIFFSDHGMRYGSILFTYTGWLETRLPFFYMSVPKWFRKKYPEKYANLVKNAEKLTTPYDVYMTLQDILVISGNKYKVKQSSACPKCKSLFEEIETERSCEDAGIELQWCACNGFFSIPRKSMLVEEAAKFILNEIHRTIVNNGGDYHQCLDFEIKEILSASMSHETFILQKKQFYLLIAFKTNPEAYFRGTVSINISMPAPVFKMEGSISRLDMYCYYSWCVSDETLKKYCYCRGVVTKILSFYITVYNALERYFTGEIREFQIKFA